MSDARTRLSAAVAPVERAIAALTRGVIAPLGDLADRVLTPLDAALEPAAGAFNARLGPAFGTVTGLQFGFLALAFLGLATAGLWAPLVRGGLLRTLALACIWAVFAMGWDVQSGYTGYISFGHSALSAAAGYTTALLLVYVDPGLPLAVTALLSVLAALGLGLLVALPTLRLEGPYFSLITFVVVLLFYRLTTAYDALGGIPGFQQPSVFTWNPALRFYYMLVPMVVVAVALTYLARSNLGLVLVAIRENEPAVSAAGIDPTRFKVWSFVLSSVPMGIGGVMLVGFTGNVDPNTFVIVDNSIEMIAMAVLGGMSSILGPLGGAFLFEILNHQVFGGFPTPIRYIALWTIVLGVLVFARRGIFRALWHRLGAIGGGEP